MNADANKNYQGEIIWIDLEMTGLDCDHDRIIEIATIITDANLNIIAEGPDIVIHQSDEVLLKMDAWNTKHHTASGLAAKVKESYITEAMAEAETLAFLQRYVASGRSPMAGNSICQDRRFLSRCMPNLEKHFHYRNLDVSTIKELALRWRPKLMQQLKKDAKHRALEDIYDSIQELKLYREHFFVMN